MPRGGRGRRNYRGRRGRGGRGREGGRGGQGRGGGFIEKDKTPPKNGESHTRTKNNRIEKWCGRCKYWTWADKAHETADCPNTAAANVAGAEEVSRNVAMQAAAMNPISLNENGVDADTIAKEIEIAKDQLRAEGKPEGMLENIAKGKLNRFFKDNTLVNQDYIKDSSMSVAAYVKSVDAGLTVTGFKRVALG